MAHFRIEAGFTAPSGDSTFQLAHIIKNALPACLNHD
jgi:hypothetical protein